VGWKSVKSATRSFGVLSVAAFSLLACGGPRPAILGPITAEPTVEPLTEATPGPESTSRKEPKKNAGPEIAVPSESPEVTEEEGVLPAETPSVVATMPATTPTPTPKPKPNLPSVTLPSFIDTDGAAGFLSSVIPFSFPEGVLAPDGTWVRLWPAHVDGRLLGPSPLDEFELIGGNPGSFTLNAVALPPDTNALVVVLSGAGLMDTASPPKTFVDRDASAAGRATWASEFSSVVQALARKRVLDWAGANALASNLGDGVWGWFKASQGVEFDATLGAPVIERWRSSEGLSTDLFAEITYASGGQAMRSRPDLVPQGLGGLPAIEFGGASKSIPNLMMTTGAVNFPSATAFVVATTRLWPALAGQFPSLLHGFPGVVYIGGNGDPASSSLIGQATGGFLQPGGAPTSILAEVPFLAIAVTSNTGALSGLTVGCFQNGWSQGFWRGRIAEIIVVKEDLDETQRAPVVEYLRAKYNF
jgi:hypothetical protein